MILRPIFRPHYLRKRREHAISMRLKGCPQIRVVLGVRRDSGLSRKQPPRMEEQICLQVPHQLSLPLQESLQTEAVWIRASSWVSSSRRQTAHNLRAQPFQRGAFSLTADCVRTSPPSTATAAACLAAVIVLKFRKRAVVRMRQMMSINPFPRGNISLKADPASSHPEGGASLSTVRYSSWQTS
jgi:hypothetical protein